MESHYCRRDIKKLYLGAELNISVIYKLYCETYCLEEKTKPVSVNVYRTIFNSYDPPLSFHVLKKDQCSKCNSYYGAQDKTEFEIEWQLHKKREKEAMEMKASDKKEALDQNGVTCRAITFDLEAILNIPFSADSQIYYRRKLSVYNFTIFDYDHLEIIDIKFMESGHSYLEADSMHATVERARKNRKIYTTEESALLIEMGRQKPRPYNVDTLTFPDFYDLQALASKIMTNSKLNTTGDQVKWLKIKWLRFEKSKPFVVQYKYELSEELFLEFNALKAKRGKTVT